MYDVHNYYGMSYAISYTIIGVYTLYIVIIIIQYFFILNKFYVLNLLPTYDGDPQTSKKKWPWGKKGIRP